MLTKCHPYQLTTVLYIVHDELINLLSHPNQHYVNM